MGGGPARGGYVGSLRPRGDEAVEPLLEGITMRLLLGDDGQQLPRALGIADGLGRMHPRVVPGTSSGDTILNFQRPARRLGTRGIRGGTPDFLAPALSTSVNEAEQCKHAIGERVCGT